MIFVLSTSRELSSLPEEVRMQAPVRTMTGLNHISFNTGNVPAWPAFRDLPADIEGPEARRIIAEENAFFIDFCARKVEINKGQTMKYVKLQYII